MSDILREVEEEVRKDQMLHLAKTYGPYVIGAAAVALVGVVGFSFWRDNQARQVQEAAASYDAAIDAAEQNNFADAIRRLDAIAANAPRGIATLAALQSAALKAEQGDAKAALAGYDAAVAKAADPDLKAIAQLKAGYAAAAAGEPRAAVERRVKALSEGDSAFAPLARELIAALAWSAGEGAKARAIYAPLSLDPNADAALRERAQQAVAVIDAAAAIAKEPLPDRPQGLSAPSGAGVPPELLAQLRAAEARQIEEQRRQAAAQARAMAEAEADAAVAATLDQVRAAAAAAEEPAPAAPPPEGKAP